MKPKQSFEDWKAKVNAIVEQKTLCGCDDLPDWRYYDAYAEGMSSSQAAKAVIRNAMDY